jgi:hypothetical protein
VQFNQESVDWWRWQQRSGRIHLIYIAYCKAGEAWNMIHNTE